MTPSEGFDVLREQRSSVLAGLHESRIDRFSEVRGLVADA